MNRLEFENGDGLSLTDEQLEQMLTPSRLCAAEFVPPAGVMRFPWYEYSMPGPQIRLVEALPAGATTKILAPRPPDHTTR